MPKFSQVTANSYISFSVFFGRPIAQGLIGQALYGIEQQAYQHWNNRAECVMRNYDDDSYFSLPINPIYVFNVKIELIGQIDPLPYL